MNAAIFITGFMGSGKTYWGKLWAKQNHLSFFDLDAEIEKVAGETIAKIFENKSEEHFREMEKNMLRDFAGKKNFILACGGGTPCFFNNMKWMNDQGATIYLKASAAEILRNIKDETMERPLLNKLDQSELLFFIQQKLNKRELFYNQSKHVLHVNELSVHSLSEIIKPIVDS